MCHGYEMSGAMLSKTTFYGISIFNMEWWHSGNCHSGNLWLPEPLKKSNTSRLFERSYYSSAFKWDCFGNNSISRGFHYCSSTEVYGTSQMKLYSFSINCNYRPHQVYHRWLLYLLISILNTAVKILTFRTSLQFEML